MTQGAEGDPINGGAGTGEPEDTSLWGRIKRDKVFATLGTVVAVVLGISLIGVYNNKWSYTAWMSFAELAVLSVGLISLRLVHKQLRLQTEQSRKDLEWKRIQSFYEFFGDLPDDSMNKEFHALTAELEISTKFTNEVAPIELQTVNVITASFQKESTMKGYLDAWEGFAGAVRCGLVSDEFAFGMESGRVIRTYTVLRPFIEKVQRDYNPRAYVQLELLAKAWITRREAEDADTKSRTGVRSGTLLDRTN